MPAVDDLRFALVVGAWVELDDIMGRRWKGHVVQVDGGVLELVERVWGVEVTHRLRLRDVRRVRLADISSWSDDVAAELSRWRTVRLLLLGAALLALRVVLEGPSVSRETLLGINTESPVGLGLAVAASLVVAAGVMRRRSLLTASAGVLSGALAWFDVVEALHMAKESRLALAALATVVAMVHVYGAVAAGRAAVDTSREDRRDTVLL